MKNMGPENLLNLVINQCNRMGNEKEVVRMYQLEYILSKLNLGKDYEVQKYIRGKYPKILGVILKNKLYLPVYPESIKNYQLDKISGINDLKKSNLLTLEEFLMEKSKLEKLNKMFSYLDVKHIFNDEKGIAFVRLGGENLIPIQKFKDEQKILKKYYDAEKVDEILTGIHKQNNRQKLDEFSIDDLIFDKKIPDDERTEYIKKYNNNQREFKNVILAINSFFVSEEKIRKYH